ncbi:hypothetical protein CTheo_3266 [Ceratobasidium theobromae]|uniref:Ricin B lectin domain-containing protein n=1 Tax=Ceratobasidium theobromae TaxID=1582974 RepID=A0A5N5QNX4_9AGAM|nr:hypothetical protein CTheo_3266 [Ceratobasidium theobromae]
MMRDTLTNHRGAITTQCLTATGIKSSRLGTKGEDMSTTNIDPGTYRITNARWEREMLVSSDRDCNFVVAGYYAQSSDQKWLIQRLGNHYHIQDAGTGRYLTAPEPKYNASVYLDGRNSCLWEIMGLHPESDVKGYTIKLAESNLILEMNVSATWAKYPSIFLANSQREYTACLVWQLDRLGPLPSDQSDSAKPSASPINLTIPQPSISQSSPGTESRTTPKDQLISQLADQIAQNNTRLVELAVQLASQTQKLTDMSREVQTHKQLVQDREREIWEHKQKIEDKEREIEDRERQIRELTKSVEEKDQLLLRMAARLAEGGGPSVQSQDQGQTTEVSASNESSGEGILNEVGVLREKVERLEGLMMQVSNILLRWRVQL